MSLKLRHGRAWFCRVWFCRAYSCRGVFLQGRCVISRSAGPTLPVTKQTVTRVLRELPSGESPVELRQWNSASGTPPVELQLDRRRRQGLENHCQRTETVNPDREPRPGTQTGNPDREPRPGTETANIAASVTTDTVNAPQTETGRVCGGPCRDGGLIAPGAVAVKAADWI